MRLNTGMVFQEFNLFPHMTALDNVIEGLVTVKKMPKDKAIPIGMKYLQKVGLEEKKDVTSHPSVRWAETARRHCPCPGHGAQGHALR